MNRHNAKVVRVLAATDVEPGHVPLVRVEPDNLLEPGPVMR